MTDAIPLVALNVGLAALGALLLLAAGAPRSRRHLATVAGLAPAVGLAAGGLAATLGAMVGIDVGLGSALIALAAVAGVALAARRTSRATLTNPSPAGAVGRVVEVAALGALALLSLAVVRLAAVTPLDQWDGWAIWGAKSHALYVGGDIWSPVFTEPEYVMQHQEYPVLLPALEALSAEALGRFDSTLIDVQAAVVVAAFGLAAWALLRLAVYPAVAACAALALTGSAPLAANAGANYADTVVASFTALGTLSLFLWLTRGASLLLVPSAVFLAAAALTKSEGLIFVVAGLVATLVLAPRFERSRRVVLLLAGGIAVLPVAWSLVDRLNGPGARNVDTGALIDPDAYGRIPTAAERLANELAGGWTLATLALAVALAAACLARVWWEGAFVALWAGLSFAALVFVYFVSVNPIDWHLGTSADRVVFSLGLGAATLAPVLVSAAWHAATCLRADPEAGWRPKYHRRR